MRRMGLLALLLGPAITAVALGEVNWRAFRGGAATARQARSEPGLASSFEPERDRTVVHQLDVHHRAEFA